MPFGAHSASTRAQKIQACAPSTWKSRVSSKVVPVELRQPCDSSLACDPVDDLSCRTKVAKLMQSRKRQCPNLVELQGAAFSKGLVAKLNTARRCDTVEQVAASEGIICNSYYRRGHCHASAPTTLMPAKLTCRKRGAPVKAPSGTIPSGFMGTWTASMTRNEIKNVLCACLLRFSLSCVKQQNMSGVLLGQISR